MEEISTKEKVEIEKKPKLWTKNFTIIILGSFVSMLGHSCTNFSFSLLVFDKTQSVALYSLMLAAGIIPQLFVPIFAGAVLDRHSRKNAIYIIDFIYTFLFVGLFVLTYINYFNYAVYFVIMFVFGCLNSFYTVAYDSLYPNLISKGNYDKAYSVSSLIYPIASTIMIPITGIIYEKVGLIPLFLGSAVLFLVTALVETRIDCAEPHLIKLKAEKESGADMVKINPFKKFGNDLVFGMKYLEKEKGLKSITAFFFCTTLAGSVLSTLYLPYFKTEYADGIFLFNNSFILTATLMYSVIMVSNTIGRLLGGLFHYFVKLPPHKKYNIAISVYITLSLIDGAMLFMPYLAMLILNLAGGFLAVNSFNIRISGTQNYVPDSVRGRFNATFVLLTNAGSIIGQLLTGRLGDILAKPHIALGAMVFNTIAIFAIILRMRKYIKPIYNSTK